MIEREKIRSLEKRLWKKKRALKKSQAQIKDLTSKIADLERDKETHKRFKKEWRAAPCPDKFCLAHCPLVQGKVPDDALV